MKRGDMGAEPWEREMNQLKTKWPGTTRNSRASAAVALLDRREEVEGRKVTKGLLRFCFSNSLGSLPSVEVLWSSVDTLEAWMPTRLPATPLITGWKTAMSGKVVTAPERILPPKLEMTIAHKTGVQPFTRISLVSGCCLALVMNVGLSRR